MQSRSRMAALAIALGLAATAHPVLGGDEPVSNTVKLDLQIRGLGSQGCVIEVKPAHPGCEFQAFARRVPEGSGAVVHLQPIPVEVRSISADRDCTFAITIREPNQPPKTFRRGTRLTPQVAGKPKPEQTLTCFLSSPSSVAAKDGAARPRR
jgi:hypothetical protein